MEWHTPLFEGQLVYLGSIDPDKDAEIESSWTNNSQFQRLLDTDLVRPLSVAQIKKKYTEIEKEMDERGNRFYFTIRRLPSENGAEVSSEGPKDEGRLLGFASLDWVEWSQGVGSLSLGIGEQAERGKGYGSDALKLLLRYAFGELNLYRLGATIPEYNPAALSLFERAGFLVEARRREALQREGRRWDMIHLGILREEWEQKKW
jgi:RimJ/RimL family protein N-acetyltransferase